MLAAGSALGPYRVLSPLGAGAMGEVYRGHDARLERDVAIKVLPPEWAGDAERLRRFETEARAVGQLNHPNLLTVHDLGRHEGVAFLVTELLEGETLAHRLRRGPIPTRRAIDFANQTAAGLAAAHEKGVIHRDIKPANLFVTRGGRIKILDFGIAKVRQTAARGDTTLADTGGAATSPGAMIGTVGYMAPEQARGQEVDERVDIFALGAVLYEMLCGRQAFRGRSAADTIAAVLRADPERLREDEAPVALWRVVQRCLEKERSERFADARGLGYALEALRGVEGRSPAGDPDPLRSIAVLLFRDFAGDSQNAHLAVGLADALVAELAQVESLTVRPTAACLRFRDSGFEPQVIGRELGVDAVVDGSFQRAGDRLRVTAQLIEVPEAISVWATKIDGTADEMFELQDRLAARLLEALRVSSGAFRQRKEPEVRPAGPAYEAYLKGRLHLFRETGPDTQAAIECFETALAAAGDFALARAGLADAYCRMAFTFDSEGDWWKKAHESCRLALEAEPDLPEGRYTLARLLWCPEGGWDHAGAMRELAAALAHRPMNRALDWLGILLFHIDLLEPAERALRRALEIDPDDAIARVHLGTCLYFQRDWAGSLRLIEEVSRRAPTAWAYGQIARCRIQLGDLERAEQVIREATTLFPDCVYFHSVPGIIAARRGERAEAERRVERAAGFGRTGHYHHAEHDVAIIWSILGELEPALDWLERSATNGFPSQAVFRSDPLLAGLRGHPRFEALMERLEREVRSYRETYEELFEGG